MPSMRDEVLQTLRRVNESFYQTFATPFSATRERLQPGVLRAVQTILPQAKILDLGCGNGELARYLFQHGHQGMYIGIDLSDELLEHAQERAPYPQARFIPADLADPDWTDGVRSALRDDSTGFDRILAFAVLHHIPGAEYRARLARQVRTLLFPGGSWDLSVWDFLASQRLRARILPWSEVGLTEADVEPGDYLIDWRRGGFGRRYVHHFSPQNLSELAQVSGFRVRDTYRSDGENGQLGLYQVWEPDPSAEGGPDSPGG
jgi:tRNA (uracil-5-)-methyltransferase TRM9